MSDRTTTRRRRALGAALLVASVLAVAVAMQRSRRAPALPNASKPTPRGLSSAEAPGAAAQTEPVLASIRGPAQAWIARVRRAQQLQTPAAHRKMLERLSTLPDSPNGTTIRLDDRYKQAQLEPTGGSKLQPAEPLLSWEFDGADELPLRLVGDDAIMKRVEDHLVIEARESGKHIGATQAFTLVSQGPLSIPAARIGTLEIRARAKHSRAMLLGWSATPRRTPDWADRLSIDLVDDGQWHTYRVDVHQAIKRGLERNATLRSVFLQPVDRTPDTVEIDFIRLRSRLAQYSEHPVGTAYQEVNDELRHVLYSWAGYQLTYSLELPREGHLSVGVASLLKRAPCTMAIRLDDAEGSHTLWSGSATQAAWQEVKADLSAWAGRKVRLTFEVKPGAKVCLWSNPTVRTPPKRPFNVIVVLEDALRADHLGAWGYARATSPTHDQLAAQGARFENAYSQATKTRPSVPSLMTSLLPSATSVWNWSDRLDDNYLTLAETLRAMGFVTASFVENGNAGPYAGLHQGFEQLTDADILGEVTSEVLGPRVVRWVDAHAGQNFFLYLHVIDPHGRYDPPQDAHRFEPSGSERTPIAHDPRFDPDAIEHPTLQGRRARYDGEIRANDDALANLVKGLSAHNVLDDTLLVLLADHGEYLGEHNLWGHNPPGHVQGIHVPLVMRYPKRIKPQVQTQPVMLLDVMPTILDFAGADPSELGLHGDSLADWVSGGQPPNRVALSEEPLTMTPGTPCGCGSVFVGTYHLLLSRAHGGKLAIYDHAKDPGEDHAVSGLHDASAIASAMSTLLTQVQEIDVATATQLSPPAAEQVEMLDPGVQQQLKALGYVSDTSTAQAP